MQSIARRGFLPALATSVAYKQSFLVSRQCVLRSPTSTPVTARLSLISRLHGSPINRATTNMAVAPALPEALEGDTDLITRFEDLGTRGLIHQALIHTITQHMKLETMTPVQSQTINEALRGVDT